MDHRPPARPCEATGSYEVGLGGFPRELEGGGAFGEPGPEEWSDWVGGARGNWSVEYYSVDL